MELSEGDDEFKKINMIEKEEAKEITELKKEIEVVQTLEDYAKGCIIGAFVGDAAGVVLEFTRNKIDMEVVEYALSFPGGGCMRVKKGQITDDSEMALCLMRGILRSEDGDLNQEYLAEEYLRWYKSHPFDIGATTSHAMRCIEKYFNKYFEENHLDKLIDNIHSVNHNSQSNGCLMRATPLSVYLYVLDVDKIYEFTKKDVNLTHSHPITIHAVTCYNIAIAHLLNNFDDYEGAINTVNEYIRKIDDKNCANFIKIWKQTKKATSEEDLITAKEKIGYVLIAFSYAFFYLKNNFTYEEAMKRMLLQGGDTDTNAAIVGGLLGARWGIKRIPEKWVNSLNFNNSRKHFVELKNVQELEENIEALLKKASALK